MTRVVLTGATGLIGSHLARLLVREGCEVHAVVRPGGDRSRLADVLDRVHLIEGRLEDGAELGARIARIAPELCIHLGWTTEPGKYLGTTANVDLLHGSAHLAAQLAAAGCRRFVGVGTCFEYDTDTGTLAETSPLRPAHLYAACKASLHLLLEQLGAASGMEVAWARLFYLYGPTEDERRLVPFVIRSLLRGAEVPTTAGAQVRDYLHVEDVASALWAIARSKLTGAVNVGSGTAITVREIVTTIADIVGQPALVRLGALPYAARDPMFVCADTRRLVEHTGWQPVHSLEDGLRHTVAWWRSRMDA